MMMMRRRRDKRKEGEGRQAGIQASRQTKRKIKILQDKNYEFDIGPRENSRWINKMMFCKYLKTLKLEEYISYLARHMSLSLYYAYYTVR